MPALRMTAYKVAVDLLKEYGLYDTLKHNKSERTLYNPRTNNLWIFTSVDDPEKIKSSEFNYEHMEETNEFSYEDFIILDLRLSGPTNGSEKNQLFMSYNTTDEHNWINKKVKSRKDVEVIHSTYKDNPFLADTYRKKLENLKDQDESYYRIYTLGLYAELKGFIHKHKIVEVDEFPEQQEIIFGLDFGFINPTALIQVDIHLEEMALYFTELLYETELTNAQLIEKLEELLPEKYRKKEMYADSAEPARIEEIYRNGFNVFSSNKSVKDGIDFLNRFKLYTCKDNVNFNDEMRGYKRKVDKKDVILEEPLRFNDHFPCAARYAVYTHLRERLIGKGEPGWVYHAGMAKEDAETEAEKDRKEKPAEKPDEVKKDKEDKKATEPKKVEESDDDSWVVT